MSRTINRRCCGLFLVRELARLQGGDAWYEPGPDGGACFAVLLPAVD